MHRRTTLNEYRKYIEKDAALERRFQTVKVEALRSKKQASSSRASPRNTKPTTRPKSWMWPRGRRQAHRPYLTGRFPAGQSHRCHGRGRFARRHRRHDASSEIKDVEAEIERIRLEKKAASQIADFEESRRLRDSEKQAKEKLDAILAEWKDEQGRKRKSSSPKTHHAHHLEVDRVPLSAHGAQETQIARDGTELQRGESPGRAVTAISKALRRSRADLKDPRRRSPFIFLGPTGVGEKRSLARTLAEFMFGDADSLIQTT